MVGEPSGLVELLLVGGAPRHLSVASAAIEVGAVRLGAWQVHRVVPTPAEFPGSSAYLVKVNFDVELAPEVPVPPWLEVGFAFDGGAVVVDAVPRAAGNAATYAVDWLLSLVETSQRGGNDVHLPGLTTPVRVFGRGSAGIRWRLVGPEPGSYSAWLTLLVPAPVTDVDVTASARYDLPDTFGHVPVTRPRTFRLDLVPPETPQLTASPPAPTETRPTEPRDPPRVFISYAHDDGEHIAKVVALAEFLVSCGLDVHMDRWDLEIARDWYVRALHQIKVADFVLVIASPVCKAVGDGEVGDTRNRGLQSEMSIIRESVHAERTRSIRRILRVVLPGRSPDEIPTFLQPRTVDHFKIRDFTVDGAEGLLRMLIGKPPYVRPERPEDVITLPPRSS